jgi:DNA-binding CsgD family transcriptional regulator
MTDKLTPRELEAARIAAQGKSNKEIAAKMGIKESAVQQYLSRSYEKLEVHSRSALLYRVLSSGRESL